MNFLISGEFLPPFSRFYVSTSFLLFIFLSRVKFGSTRYSSGVYIYRLSAESGSGNFTSIKKMVMLK